MNRVLLSGLLLLGGAFVSAAGTWIPVTNSAPLLADTMLLLSDGTVMVTAGGSNGGSGWNRLTPDAKGRYAAGTWSSVASMHDTRLYFASDVMVNGQVLVAGGEYGTGRKTAEVYDPASNTWTVVNGGPGFGTNGIFSDAISKVLPSGNVMVMPLGNNGVTFGSTAIFNFAANDFAVGGAVHNDFGQDEASWVRLGDGSVLTIDPFGSAGTNSERYIPALNQWLPDSGVPVRLYDNDGELGPAFLLPNGNAIFFGASGHTAIYTPSGTTNAGAWVQGPDMPNGMGMPDAPGAMMANGKILCALGVPNTLAAPVGFCEYDYTSNAFTVVSSPNGSSYPPFVGRMLDLPDGTVLYASSTTHLFIYQPDGTPLAAGKPAINGVTTNSDGSFRLAGTLLNGISDGAAYGDDAQMDSSYPIIYVTNGPSVYYLKTFNWSNTRVMTGTNVTTTDFMVPANVPAGNYSLLVSANGISSDPVAFSVGPVSLNPATIFLTNSDAAPNSSFNTGLNWSDGQAPVGRNNYVVSGFDLCTPVTAGDMTTFRGGSLYLTNGGALRLENAVNGDTTTIGTPPGRVMVVDGGTISDWAGQPETVGGYIVLADNGNTFDPQNTVLTMGGFISGNGSLTVDSPNGVVGGTVILPRAANYSGPTIINGADTLQLAGGGTLGTTNSTLVFSNTLGHGYGTLDLNGLSRTIPNVSGPGGSIINSSVLPMTLTIGLSNSVAAIGNGAGTFSGNIFSTSLGSISLTKSGTGTLTLTGSSALGSLNIGPTNNGTVMTNGTLVVAGGSLAVGSGAADSMNVSGGGGILGAAQGTLDLTGASNFTANVGSIQVGVAAASAAGCFGNLLLGTNNLITASTAVIIGDFTAVAQTSSLQTMSTAANGVTTLSTPFFAVGVRRCNAAFTLGRGATMNLGNVLGRSTLAVGHAGLYGPNSTGNIALSGLADFSGGILSAFLNNLVIGTKNNSGSLGSETGTVIIGTNQANHLDVTGVGTVVLIGTNFTAGSSTATGVLTISNLDSTSVIASTDNSTAILIGANPKATGTLNLYGGTLTINTAGAAIAGGAGTSVLNLGGVTLKAGASTSGFITNIGTATFTSGVTFDTAGYNLNVAQSFTGAGGIIKSDSGVLTLSKTNGYTGNTMVLAGTLALSGQGSCAGSAKIDILNGATLDASGRADLALTLNSGQALQGGGNITGNLNALAGSLINPGDGIGTLTISSNATLAGTLVMELNRTNLPACDQLASTTGSVTGGGTLTVTNLGPALQLGDRFQLFSGGVGGFGAVSLPPLPGGLAWADQIPVDGSIQVASGVSPVATNITVQVSGRNVTLSWPADHTGWRLQSQTNSLGGTNWTDVPGANQTNLYFFVIDPGAAGVFFRLTYP